MTRDGEPLRAGSIELPQGWLIVEPVYKLRVLGGIAATLRAVGSGVAGR